MGKILTYLIVLFCAFVINMIQGTLLFSLSPSHLPAVGIYTGIAFLLVVLPPIREFLKEYIEINLWILLPPYLAIAGFLLLALSRIWFKVWL